MAVLRRAADGAVTEVVAAPWSARSRRARVRRRGLVGARRRAVVRRLGHPAAAPGRAWWASPCRSRPEPAVPRGLRYADGDVQPRRRQTLLCVREEHHADGREATNTIVRLGAPTSRATPEVVVEGPDFVSDPRWRPDGAAFCWLEWDHPDMPWDATRLVVDEGGVAHGGGRRRASASRSASPPGRPTARCGSSATAPASGASTAGRPGRGIEPMVDLGKDIGFPAWVFGQSCFAFLDDGRVVFSYSDGGLERLAVREPDFGRVTHARRPPHDDRPAPRPGRRGRLHRGQPHRRGARRRRCRSTRAPSRWSCRRRDLGLDAAWFSAPEPIDFPTVGGATAHALLYPPTNPEVDRARPASARRCW